MPEPRGHQFCISIRIQPVEILVPVCFSNFHFCLRLLGAKKLYQAAAAAWERSFDFLIDLLPTDDGSFLQPADGDRRRVHALTENLDDRSCIVLYPEGTRFTPARRQRILERLAAKDDQERLDRARALECLLPMRTGGLFTLLDAAPQADLVFMAHTGLEGITRMSTLVDGTLLGRSLLVELRFVAAGDVPTEPGMRLQWMYEQWLAMDRWVAAHQPAE